MQLWKTRQSQAPQGGPRDGFGGRMLPAWLLVTIGTFLALGPAVAAPLNRLLLADDGTEKILVYDRDTQAYVNEFANASGLLSGADIVALAVNDAGTKVYVAVSRINDFNAAGARIYVYDVAVDGENVTGANPTLLYQHTLGNWGSRRSMCIGPDRNSDGKQDIYFTVPLPGWNNETVYWVDGVSGGTATSYQNIATQHNRHLEFKADGTLGWGAWLNSMSEARTYNSANVSHYNDIGTLKTGGNALLIASGVPLTDNANWRMKDLLFDADDILYYSSYYPKYDATYHRRLYRAVQNSGTGYWTPTAFSGAGLGVDTTSTGLQPGVMALLTVTPLPNGTVILLK